MRHIKQSACCALVLGACTLTMAQNEGIDDLIFQVTDLQHRAESRAALLMLIEHLHEVPESVQAVQRRVSEQLVAADDPRIVRRVSLLCAQHPSDPLVMALADKLDSGQSSAMRLSACIALSRCKLRGSDVAASTVSYALSALEILLADRECPQRTIDAAMLAVAAFGGSGFDLLVQIVPGTDSGNPKVRNVFWTALSQTADPRALALILRAVEADDTRMGTRIQAVHAMGTLVRNLQSEGYAIDVEQRMMCETVLTAYLTNDTPDQLFSVALQTLHVFTPEPQSIQVRDAVIAALSSSSPIRRAAGLSVLYQSNSSACTETRSMLETIAGFDTDPIARHSALAILERVAAESDP